MEWLIYELDLPDAKENHQDTWNTVQDLCLFVSNQGMFTIKNCAVVEDSFICIKAIKFSHNCKLSFSWKQDWWKRQ